MLRKNHLQTKVIDDAYDFLHLIEMGKSSMADLSEAFRSQGNKTESDYRQVERIKQRCLRMGVLVEFDNHTMRFRTERNAKFKYLEAVLPRIRPKPWRREAFGFFVEKHSTVEVPTFLVEDVD